MAAEEVYLRERVGKLMARKKEDNETLIKLEERYGISKQEKENNLKEWNSTESKKRLKVRLQ